VFGCFLPLARSRDERCLIRFAWVVDHIVGVVR
jgi:hypothetical protein